MHIHTSDISQVHHTSQRIMMYTSLDMVLSLSYASGKTASIVEIHVRTVYGHIFSSIISRSILYAIV